IEDEEFVKNTSDRCYFCKRKSARFLKGIAKEEGIETVAYGVNISDFSEHRPGIKACDEEGIWHPFVEASLTKSDVREISWGLGMPSWDKPSTACLSSRIPYGDQITIEKLKMVEDAEEILRSFGFLQSRVRLHGKIARIEVMCAEMEDLIALGSEIHESFKDLGFDYVSMDLLGYRSGSMDEVL
ncbi:MAG: ATP-dependent sacrificial sulfur transferase LarE, partial [Halobacteriota archaeon]|nr:ATP-dependent sacrificial sulfur transferase LarE [Halobacteriota archaeon]